MSTKWSRAKEKKKNRETKESRQDLCLWEGAIKEAKFLHNRKSFHWQGKGGALEEGAATSVQRAKQKGLHTEISAD